MSLYEDSPLADIYGLSYPLLYHVAAVIHTTIRYEVIYIDSRMFSFFYKRQVSSPSHYRVVPFNICGQPF